MSKIISPQTIIYLPHVVSISHAKCQPRVWEPKVSKCRKLSMQALFNLLVLGDACGMSSAN